MLWVGEGGGLTRSLEYTAYLVRKVATQPTWAPPGTRQPPSLRELIVHLVLTGHTTFTTFALSLFYLRRIQRLRGNLCLGGPPHLVYLVALVVTAKFWFDEPPPPAVNYWFSAQVSLPPLPGDGPRAC